MLELFALPFLACLVLAAMHVYLGLHVLVRGIIFVDLALAQLAALGMAVALLAGHAVNSDAAYAYALAFTLAGAVFFAVSRGRSDTAVPQEAVIGIVYAVSAAVAILILDRAPQGSEHIKQLLVGGILTVTPGEVGALALLYAALGVAHAMARRPLLEISRDPDGARRTGRRVLAWDLFFYASFGLVVTSSVRVAGVLLVFSFLVVPAAISALLVGSLAARLLLGWVIGASVSALGLWASYHWDLPTGAAVVAAFGAAFGAVGLLLATRLAAARVRSHGLRGLAGAAAAACAVVAVAGLLLATFPRIDQPWLDWTEARIPALRTLFMSADDATAYAQARDDSERGADELQRLRVRQQDVQWGREQMSEERQERLRQYLAGRSEIVAGDRLVMARLQQRVRENQRWTLGLPLALLGAVAAGLLLRARRKRQGSGADPG